MEPIRDRLERALTPILSVAAIVIAATSVHREFFADSSGVVQPLGGPPVLESRWEDAVESGVRIGPDDARVTIVEFVDFQCPACRVFHSDVKETLRDHPEDAALVLVHFPLPGHRFALDAARAAECASALGRFASFVDVVFSKQDSLGAKTWRSYASEAGIHDTIAFDRCLHDSSAVKRIEEGRALGLRFNIPGTPTVIVNGWRYSYPPSRDELDRVVRNAIRGKGTA